MPHMPRQRLLPRTIHPLIVENVRGAVPWVGREKAKFGSFYLWGDVGMVGNRVFAGRDLTDVMAGCGRFGMGVAPVANRRATAQRRAESRADVAILSDAYARAPIVDRARSEIHRHGRRSQELMDLQNLCPMSLDRPCALRKFRASAYTAVAEGFQSAIGLEDQARKRVTRNVVTAKMW